MWSSSNRPAWRSALLAGSLLSTSSAQASCNSTSQNDVDLGWYPPSASDVNNLTAVLTQSGVYDFVFNSSTTPASVPYDTYNWCNMPHVRPQEYQVAPKDYVLEYVEVIQRHHKRTPYASNTFPHESYSWECDDEALLFYGIPIPDSKAAQIAWSVYTTDVNPFAPTGFNGTCQFPQLTRGGLEDSRQHGSDLYNVYHENLSYLPAHFDPTKIQYRVTNNVITSQVVSQVILGMYPSTANNNIPVLIQPDSIDSLEPTYSCPRSDTLRSTYGVGSNFTNWTAHLTAPETTSLFARLNEVSNVNSSSSSDDWYSWFDHYFDNLSSRLCHDKPLPCTTNNETCITQPDADAVFRRGLYEYSFIYRDSPSSLASSVASYGVWLAEVASHLRAVRSNATAGQHTGLLYRHNIAHDGSISRLLSILQLDNMVWPGMGSEVVFELYSREKQCWFVRMLWKGQPLVSSSPTLRGDSDGMLPLERFLGYVDGLVGEKARLVPGLCQEEEDD